MVEGCHIFARCPLGNILPLYSLTTSQRTLFCLPIHNLYHNKSKGPIDNQLLNLKRRYLDNKLNMNGRWIGTYVVCDCIYVWGFGYQESKTRSNFMISSYFNLLILFMKEIITMPTLSKGPKALERLLG